MFNGKMVAPEDAKTTVRYPADPEAWKEINGSLYKDCTGIQIDAPVPNSVMNNKAGAIITQYMWPLLEKDIRDVCTQLQTKGKACIERVQLVTDRCRMVRVLLPIPDKLTKELEYDLGSEVTPEVMEALVIVIRRHQVQNLFDE